MSTADSSPPDVPIHRDVPDVFTLIAKSADRYLKATAVTFGDDRRTYRQLVSRANRLAQGLRGRGLQPGNSVAVVLSNRIEYPEIDLALGLGGFVRVALNTRWTLEDFSLAVDDSASRAIITEGTFDAVATELVSRHEIEWIRLGDDPPPPAVAYEDVIETGSEGSLGARPSPGAIGWISYTAGTTGRSKGVELSNFALTQVAINLAVELGPMNSASSALLPQPLSHGAGYFALPYLIGGGTVHLMAGFDPEYALDVGRRDNVTTLKLVPAMLHDLSSTMMSSDLAMLFWVILTTFF